MCIEHVVKIKKHSNIPIAEGYVPMHNNFKNEMFMQKKLNNRVYQLKG